MRLIAQNIRSNDTLRKIKNQKNISKYFLFTIKYFYFLFFQNR